MFNIANKSLLYRDTKCPCNLIMEKVNSEIALLLLGLGAAELRITGDTSR